MISNIITDMHLLDFTVLGQFDKEILVDIVKVLLNLSLGQITTGIMGRVMVHVGDKDGLREIGFDVFTRTTITMSTSTNLEVEGTVDPIKKEKEKYTVQGQEMKERRRWREIN